MYERPIVLTISLALGLALTPTMALAHHGGFHGGRVGAGQALGGPVVARPLLTRPFVTHPFGTHPFCPRPFFGPVGVHRFVPFAVVTSPVVGYTPPPVVYSPSPVVYAPPAVAYDPPPTQVRASPPMPTVIEYPHGRYELSGDGVTAPYQWVWIPNPSPPPPSSAPPEPSQSTPPATPHSAPGAPGGRGRIYSWTDEHGVTTWTDAEDSVPERYRAQAERLQATRI
jgi:hypothetical protein